MKIVDKINEARRNQTPVYSFEFFPPKTEDSVANLYDRMGRMARLEPTFISCTWGAGGSTSEKTLDICATAQSVYGLETVMHLTCTNMEKEKLDKALKEAKNAGINNILALRGDPPRGQEYWTACDSRFSYASDLVKYIREQYGDYFCIGVAGYPEGHVDSTDKSMDLQHLKAKIDAGADFIVSQLFYDISAFEAWVKSCREIGIKVPIIAGVMPIPTYQIFRRIINLCKINVPRNIMETLDGIRSDDQKVKEYGVHLATEMVKRLASNDQVSGIHFTTLNLERSPKLVLQELKWLKESAAKTKSTKVPLAWAPGGDPTRAENWDEFPNGRYGDARSPAFGENLLSASQLQPTSAAASKWGHPEKTSDITALFEKYINGKLGSLPWCEEPLQTETDSIRQQLCELNRNGYWTVASQPAVNGAKSEDPVYGWGPKGGYVYQKAFLEFFVSDTQLSALLEKLDQDASITYYATNSLGALKTNMKDPKAQNAVTWGVFPGKEIVQPTIIELVSFEAWRDEAFALWADWQRQYPPNSPSAKLLKDISENYWLVNVVHNDYQQSDGLFKAILS